MKQTNWRFVITGGVAIVLALGFVLFMGSIASQSTDPKALMETVGTTSGVVGGDRDRADCPRIHGKKILVHAGLAPVRDGM
jgi:hypothetical protein